MSQQNNGPGDAESLVRRMKAIRESAMRRASMAEYLIRTDSDRAVRSVATLIERAPGADAYTVALDAVSWALSDEELIDYDTRSRLYTAAVELELTEVSRMLFTAPPAGFLEIAVLEEEAKAERPIRPRGRPLTLGERKSLARGHRREALEPLIRDPHPDVIEILLGNPNIVEQDVLIVASRRPSIPASLARVFGNARWITRYRVRRALVLNPYTPIPISVRLMTTLRDTDLRHVASDGKLHIVLQRHAKDILHRRGRWEF